jgi:hypothetical protein
LSLTCLSLPYLEFSAAGFISKLELRSLDSKVALDVYSSWYDLHILCSYGPNVLLGFAPVLLRLECPLQPDRDPTLVLERTSWIILQVGSIWYCAAHLLTQSVVQLPGSCHVSSSMYSHSESSLPSCYRRCELICCDGVSRMLI